MISFRKHATESTRRPNSLLRRRAAASLLILLLAASAAPAAPQRQHRQGRDGAAGVKTAPGPQATAQDAKGRPDEPAEESLIPVRVTRIETPDGPAVVATIGDFPSDLDEAGQEFLSREFFEQFASDVLGLEDARATVKVALLPQEKENQREGDFTAGKFSGRMIVLVERRRVFVACTYSVAERKHLPLASVGRYFAGASAAE